MKSPEQLKSALCRFWEKADRRETLLLGGSSSWPIILTIGKPTSKQITSDIDRVKRHIDQWREIRTGEVIWEPVSYRATLKPVDFPVKWILRNPTEWIAACHSRLIRDEFSAMSLLVEQADVQFHSLLVRKRSLWRDKPIQEVLQACRLAIVLSPRCAAKKPLRMLPLEGIDTKFFERNSGLITALLDVRFDGEVNKMGLETFLDAAPEGEHWLLIVDLDGSLLPFKKIRVSSSDIAQNPLPGTRILIVENERCQHHLPGIPETIAVLGTGFDLDWTQARWLNNREVGYWGDIDTWGLQFLANVRTNIPHVSPLMMSSGIFERFRNASVPEPIVAANVPPEELTPSEQSLYEKILKEDQGRLEQEFIPEECVHEFLQDWCGVSQKNSVNTSQDYQTKAKG